LALNNKNINGILDSSGKNERLEKNSADAINNAKTGYFNSAKGYLDEFKKGEHLNDKLRDMASIDTVMGKNTKQHKKRIELLCKFMGIEVPKDIDSEGQVDTSASSVNDVDVHEYYHYVLKGKRFNKEYGKNWNKFEYSIDEMLNFETMSLDEDTKKNFAQRTGMKLTDFVLKMVGIRDKSKNPEIAKADIGHYVRYRTILDMYNEKKPKEEIFKAYRQLGGGDGYEKYLRGKKEEVVTPDEIIHYEKNHVSNEGRYHEYLLKQLNELDSNTSDKDAVDFYVKQARLSDVTLFEKLKSKIAAIGIDFDTEFQKEIKPEDYLTPEVIMQYEEAAYKSKAAKHQYRIDILSKEDVTDENVYATYTETLGGGKGFFKNSKNSELLEKEQNETVRYYMTYNEIMKYENKRKEAYKKTMDAANAPLKDLFDVRNELQAQMLKLDSYKKQIVEYTAKPVGDVFKDAGSIEKFEEETMGSDAVNVLAESEDALNDSDSVKLEALMDEIVKCQEELEALESDDEKDPTTANK
jgi:hypothetical protein